MRRRQGGRRIAGLGQRGGMRGGLAGVVLCLVAASVIGYMYYFAIRAARTTGGPSERLDAVDAASDVAAAVPPPAAAREELGVLRGAQQAGAGDGGGGDKVPCEPVPCVEVEREEQPCPAQPDCPEPLPCPDCRCTPTTKAIVVDCETGSCPPCPPDRSGGPPEDRRWANEVPREPLPTSPPANPRYAVLGLAKNIKLELAQRFLMSLRTHAPDVDIVIFTDFDDGKHGALYRALGVRVVLYSEAELEPAKMRSYHPSSYRWALISDYLDSRAAAGQPYEAVMFTDTRDTYFQSHPFALLEQPDSPGAGLYAFQEARPKTIRECGWNSGWVKDCFGTEGLAQVGRNIISCSGTSIATWDTAREYAALMKSEILSNPCERNGVDQGMHNYFVYTQRITPTHLIANEDGPIATVQAMATLRHDWFGRVINDNGAPYAVVHQYDRSSSLDRIAAAKNVFVLPRGVDAGCETC